MTAGVEDTVLSVEELGDWEMGRWCCGVVSRGECCVASSEGGGGDRNGTPLAGAGD